MLNFKKKNIDEKFGQKIPRGFFDFRKYVNSQFFYLGYNKDIPLDIPFKKWYNEKNGFSRQRLHYWIKKYWKYLDNEEIVREAEKFLDMRRKERTKKANINSDFVEKIVMRNVISHKKALMKLEKSLGKKKCLEIAKKSKPYFDYLIKDCRLGRVEVLKVNDREWIINNAIPEK